MKPVSITADVEIGLIVINSSASKNMNFDIGTGVVLGANLTWCFGFILSSHATKISGISYPALFIIITIINLVSLCTGLIAFLSEICCHRWSHENRHHFGGNHKRNTFDLHDGPSSPLVFGDWCIWYSYDWFIFIRILCNKFICFVYIYIYILFFKKLNFAKTLEVLNKLIE